MGELPTARGLRGSAVLLRTLHLDHGHHPAHHFPADALNMYPQITQMNSGLKEEDLLFLRALRHLRIEQVLKKFVHRFHACIRVNTHKRWVQADYADEFK